MPISQWHASHFLASNTLSDAPLNPRHAGPWYNTARKQKKKRRVSFPKQPLEEKKGVESPYYLVQGKNSVTESIQRPRSRPTTLPVPVRPTSFPPPLAPETSWAKRAKVPKARGLSIILCTVLPRVARPCHFLLMFIYIITKTRHAKEMGKDPILAPFTGVTPADLQM